MQERLSVRLINPGKYHLTLRSVRLINPGKYHLTLRFKYTICILLFILMWPFFPHMYDNRDGIQQSSHEYTTVLLLEVCGCGRFSSSENIILLRWAG